MRKMALAVAVLSLVSVSSSLAAKKSVEVRWFGHAFVLITTPAGVRVAMDPFGRIGYPMPEVEADVVTVSHAHSDHSNAAYIWVDPKVLQGLEPGGKAWADIDYRGKDVRIRSFPAYHDKLQGKQRGLNSIFLVEVAGLRIVHMSDIGQIPSQPVLDSLGRIDLLFVPVGGTFSIDAKEATQTVARLEPSVVVPIHYKTDVTASWPISDEQAFVRGKPRVKSVGHRVMISKDTLPEETEIWLMSYR
jgi:L-ascorbate metabolism protein UlaG (beta-lactamase superfamily)